MVSKITKHMQDVNNSRRVLIGLLVGSFAGAVAMLLFAPQSGKKTRDQIEEKSIELRDQTTANLKKAAEQIRFRTKGIAAGVQKKTEELKQLGQEKLVEQMDRVSAALDAGKTAVEAA